MSKPNIQFNNSYAKLPADFYSETRPTPVANPALIQFNTHLAEELGLSGLSVDGIAEIDYFAGNKIFDGSEPIAMAYAGHQFGGFSPKLGDGRAILLGEVVSPDSVRYDIQLKGSGPTRWSRGGDGRSALGPVLREYLVSEAMAKLGVPTTRALAAVITGEEVARNTLVPGGILTRVATGFVRVGTFQYFSSQNNIAALKQLADYEIERHYPEAKSADNPYIVFFKGVVERQARLIAQWMSFGFIHGVMNTDNMSIVGETIDYGPCAFMDKFSHNRVYSSIDQHARYAYANQPKIGQWNLVRLAETLLPLFVGNGELVNDASTQEPTEAETQAVVKIAEDILNDYNTQYHQAWLAAMRKKLGLLRSEGSAVADTPDTKIINDLLDIMQEGEADFTLTFYYLSHADKHAKAKALFAKSAATTKAFDAWFDQWQVCQQDPVSDEQASTSEKTMQSANPAYIPRNHQIEAAIRAAEDNNDFSVFRDFHQVLQNPFEEQTGKASYLKPPLPEEVVYQTFCGT